MTFDKIWQQLVAKNSKLLEDNTTVEFRAAALKKLLKQVYEQGQKLVKDADSFLNSLFKG
jgi:hypothetical protein